MEREPVKAIERRSAALVCASLPAIRVVQIALLVMMLAVAMTPDVIAEEAPAEGIVPPPAGTDIETLRKLLGLPAQPETHHAPPAAPAPAPEAQSPPPAPEPQAEAPTAQPEVKAPERGKPYVKPKAVAKPVIKRAPRPVVKAEPEETAPEPSKAEPVPAPSKQEQAKQEEVVMGSPQDIPPAGTVVSSSNQERWKHLLGPSIQWAVSRGATLPVVDAIPTPMEPFREAATKQYSPQVELSPDGNSMRNFVAGIPFPLVTDDDPNVAIKMMFNFENRIGVDDIALRHLSCDTGRIPPGRGIEVERHYEVDAFRRIFYTGRFHVDPKPTWVTPEGIRYREMLGALDEPFDLKGAGFSYIRYIDPRRPDDSWLYFPQLKRVRRLSSAQRSEGVFGQDVDLDSYAGYAGNPAWSHWKYLGKKTVLGVLHSRHFPAKFQDAPADFFPDDRWEPREVYILLAVSKLGGYNFGQRVLYLDRESLLIPYTEIYDLKGSLWKSLIQTWSFGKSPIINSKKQTYDYEQFYIPSLSMVDIQQNHVTRCYLPSDKSPKDEEGWYWNRGSEEGTTEQVFSVSHFIEAGH